MALLPRGDLGVTDVCFADRAALRVRDCAFRDPAGDMVRIQELR